MLIDMQLSAPDCIVAETSPISWKPQLLEAELVENDRGPSTIQLMPIPSRRVTTSTQVPGSMGT